MHAWDFTRAMPGRARTRPRAFYIVATLLAVIVVGVIDYAINPALSFSVFYLLAVGTAVWFVGQGFGYSVSVLCVAVSLAGDLARGTQYSSLLVPLWNESIVLGFYFIVVTLLGRIHLLTKGLEARVQERTSALIEQMGERERLERELLEASEREQRRIGHDLHDVLGQHLTGAALAAQVLQEKLALRGAAEHEDAGKVVELVEEGVALSRKFAKGLVPIAMEAGGLMQALEELAATASELFKVSCCFECDSPVLVRDAATATHLCRIAQEAVSNAIKHGNARNIVVRLDTRDEGLVLQVRDDGVGLPPVPPKGTGMGMRIMAHRASMIGAVFTARAEASGGTIIACTLPAKTMPDNASRE